MMIFSLFLGAVVICRGIWPLKLSRKWKIILSAAAAIIAFKFYILRLFGGKMFFTPELPGAVVLPATWLFALLMFFSLWLIAWDLLGLSVRICRFIRRKKGGTIFFFDPVWRSAGLIPLAILISYGMYEGLKMPEVVRKDIVISALPPELDGLQILHLTDIHVDPFTGKNKVDRIVEVSNSLSPDLVVITGDFVDGRVEVRGKDLAGLSKLQAPMGVFGVPGNHEYYSGYQQWLEALRGCGIRMLTNEHVMLGDSLALGGVTDPAAKVKREELPDVGKTFMGTKPETFRILLAHQPKLADEAAAHGVDLQLSGHTHGGMIWGMDILVGMFNKGRYSGEYDIGNMKLFISNGTGIWNGFPLRLGHRSEIVLLTLRSAK